MKKEKKKIKTEERIKKEKKIKKKQKTATNESIMIGIWFNAKDEIQMKCAKVRTINRFTQPH